MNRIFHLFLVNASVLSVLVTVAVTIFIVCCLKCSDCACKDKDDLFKRREI
jgi:capsular polysaccharide biosynthesis protein